MASDFDGSYDLVIEAYKGQLITVTSFSNSPKRAGEMDDLGIINGGMVLVKDGIITVVGDSEEVLREIEHRGGKIKPDKYIDFEAYPKVVLPGFVDTHTHLVFAGSRAHEYESKIKGEAYEAQHGNGKGILYTVNMTRQEHEAKLFYKGRKILEQMLEYGTTTMEIKSGYGLDYVNEMKILEVIDMLRTAPEANPLWKDATIIPTFMGAHAIPPEFQCRREEYVNLVISMLPEIKERGLAEFVDIFCDKLAFTVKESLKILKEAHKLGFKLKAHVDQTSDIGGRLLLNELPFVSADHMDYTDLDRVSNKDFVAVLLPGVTYHLMEIHSKKFWEIRAQEFIDKGFAIALATDYNPGSCPCFSMQTIMELAARLYRMTPAQIINAVTINAAHAVGRAHEIGSIEVGKKADILICDTGDYRDMINGFGTNKVRKVIKNGKIIK